MRPDSLGRAIAALCGLACFTQALAAQQGAPNGPAREPSDRAAVLSRPIVLQLDHASLPEAVNAIAQAGRFRVSFSADMMPQDARVSMARQTLRAGDALTRVLSGTGLRFSVLRSGLVVIGPAPAADVFPIRGVVQDAITEMPVRDAVVLNADGTTVASDLFGEFKTVASPGERLLVRRIGYEPSYVLVPDNDQKLTVTLRAAAVAVDRVIVMGSTEGSRERSYPGALTVISGETLDRLDLRRIEDAFSGMMPGVVAWDDGPGATTVALGSIRGSSSFAINYFKTYVDGVEVASPFIATGLDPAAVERIEVIRGPQGAALYGSDASSGVVQITTRGARAGAASKPRIALAAARGTMDSRFIDTGVSVSEYEGIVEGRVRAFSYSFGGTASGVGPSVANIPPGWNSPSRPVAGAKPTAGGASEISSLFAASQFALGPLSGALSSRTFRTAAELTPNPVALAEGFPIRHAGMDAGNEARRSTNSLSLRLAPVAWWSMRAVGGYDRTTLGSFIDRIAFVSAADSFVAASVGTSGRGSVRVSSEFRAAAANLLATTVTLGAERTRLSHRNEVGSTSAVKNLGWATGAFAQTNVALANTLFLTAGVRSEANTAFGADRGAVTLPLLGAALARTQGRVTLKVRAAYGKGIRPPPPGAASTGAVHAWQQIANPDLGPESQSGTEYGADLHVGNAARLQITLFDQIADGLIQLAPVNIQSQPKTVQQQNIGAISNKGWEIEGSSAVGSVTLSGHYSRTASRVRSVARQYTGALRPGDRMLEVPAWSGGLTSTIAVGRFSASATAWRVGDWVNYDWISLYRTVFVDRRQPGPVRNYWITYPGFTQLRMTASARFWRGSEIVARGDNLTNEQNAGRDNLHVNTGRTIMLGLRVRY